METARSIEVRFSFIYVRSRNGIGCPVVVKGVMRL